MEERRRHVRTMESIGQLAAGIAHEINTPTQYVSDNAIFLRESWTVIERIVAAASRVHEEWRRGSLSVAAREELDKCFAGQDIDYLANEIPKAIDETFEGARQVARIVRAMNEFAHPADGKKCACDLNHAIESTITVARNAWKYVAKVETSFDSKMPLVTCLSDQINQVMLNLILNAAYAIGEADPDHARGPGTIRIETEFDGLWANIRVSDTGASIPQELQQHVFEPFMTTKPVGKGTGQGLAMAREVIVDQHQGEIRVESDAGEGTTFFIRLPAGPGRVN